MILQPCYVLGLQIVCLAGKYNNLFSALGAKL